MKTLLGKRQSNDQRVSARVDGVLTNSPSAIGHTVSQSVSYQIIAAPPPAEIRREEFKATTPTAMQIFDAIESLPPFQRAGAKDHYLGIEICWLGRFASIHPSEDDCYSLSLSVRANGGGAPFVSCEVSLSEYPKLKVLLENHPVWIRGKISRIRAFGITVSNASLSILD